METVRTVAKKPKTGKSRHVNGDEQLFSRALICRQVDLSIVNVGKNVMHTFEMYIKMHYEGKCVVEGYVKPDTSQIISYSGGRTYGDMVSFQVVFECQVCAPTEGMNIQCRATNITRAGIRAESLISPSPVVIFITRDHYYDNDYFNTIKEGDTIWTKVIGQRFELNDTYISIVAELKKNAPHKK